jgi:hypothetical protein
MTPTELTRSIVATRNELSDAMRRNPDNIYRRLPQPAQDAWDELGLPQVWLTTFPRKLIGIITMQSAHMARMTEGGES